MNKKLNRMIVSTLALSAMLAACGAPTPAAPAPAKQAEAPTAVPAKPTEAPAAAAPAAGGEVLMLLPAEISGAGATAGANWRDGLLMAQEEINAAGGILGKKIKFEILDTQTEPSVSKAVIAKGLDQDPYVVMGPLYSGSVIVNMVEAQRAKKPQLVGAEAANITKQNNPFVFRTSFGQATSMPKIGAYLKLAGIKNVTILYVNNDFGKGGLDTASKVFADNGINVVEKLSTEQKQADFAPDVLKAINSKPDALFIYLNEEESARLLIELKKQGNKLPLYGETTLLGANVLKLAGDAANGAQGHVGLTVDAPIPAVQEFGKKFEAKYGRKSDHNGIKGYTGLYIVKEITERMGKFDSEGFANALHCAIITTKDEPGVLMDVAFHDNGDIDRESFLAEVKDGKQTITKVLPKLGNTCAEKK
jgi:branched-chain amino acid transport system substrate-binding protein